MSAADLTARLELMRVLPISIDGETGLHAWRDTVALARTERLTTYDAAYLELAMRRGIPLATQDRGLREAGRRLGVEVLP